MEVTITEAQDDPDLNNKFMEHGKMYMQESDIRNDYTSRMDEIIDKLLDTVHYSILIGNDQDPAKYGAVMVRRFDENLHVICWAYVVALHRRKGIFSRVWDMLEGHYGRLMVAPPFSEPMRAFLQKKFSS